MKSLLPVFLLTTLASAHAATIYEDSFTGPTGTKLNTRGPDVSNTTPAANYTGGDAPRLSNNMGMTVGNGVASLPLPAIKAGEIVTISLDVKTAGDNQFGYVGVGLANEPNVPLSRAGALWANIMNGGFARVWQGPSEPQGAGLALYGGGDHVADYSDMTRLVMSFDTGSKLLIVKLNDSPIFEGVISFEDLDKLKYVSIFFNQVNISGTPEPACIDNFSVTIEPGA